MLWSAVHGVVSLHITGGHEGVNWCDARQTARRACVTLVRGLLRSPGA
jgi:hypothetical protein